MARSASRRTSEDVRAPQDGRGRILQAAGVLFHGAGVRATGVDALISHAGVAKATFYHHFPSKDALVVAWLRDPPTRWFDRVRAQAQAPGAAPRDEILVFFERVSVWLVTDGFRGCPYANTAVEITDPGHPARVVISDYLDEIGLYLRSLVAAAGYADAERLGPGLEALLAGGIALAGARQTDAFAVAAQDSARRMLAAPKGYPI